MKTVKIIDLNFQQLDLSLHKEMPRRNPGDPVPEGLAYEDITDVLVKLYRLAEYGAFGLDMKG